MITTDLQQLLESGVSMLVGTRDAQCRPCCMRGMGARVAAAGAELVVFLPDATSAATLANLRDNGRIAVCFSRPFDHHSVQIKGRLSDLAPATADDHAWIERYRGGLAESLAFVGLPVSTTLRIAHWPSHAARFRVEHLFVQTPGPHAGQPLEAGRGPSR